MNSRKRPTLEDKKAEYERVGSRAVLYQYTYRLTDVEPCRITSNWYSTRDHATECLKRIYGVKLVSDSVREVEQTAAHVPQWRIWGDKSKRYIDHVAPYNKAEEV